ncbi:ferredoxin--NADP reductase [Streptosporangium sp. NPDC051022]|uniref:ferredoxin--NADP reductase n=1 Tax=Streptosporangium sp. NPDC051022 TaxID=3155752 RepID=UPI003423EE9E
MATARVFQVQVREVVRETAAACSFVLDPLTDDGALDYRPGQFLTVRVPADGASLARCYSMSSAPDLGEPPRITVKRVQGGVGSNWLCDNAVKGTVLDVIAPAGRFVPVSLDRDLVVYAGGSGITPIMSIVKAVMAAGTGRVAMLYANRDESSVIFAGELRALQERHPDRLFVTHWLESLSGVPTEDVLRQFAAPFPSRDVFVCGPGPFMESVRCGLTGPGSSGSPGRAVHIEEYRSLSGDPFGSGEPVPDEGGAAAEAVIRLNGDEHTVRWPENNRLLDVLLAAGMDVPYSCREGSCSACACILLEGEVAHDANTILEEQDLEDGVILPCQARALTERVVVSYDH